MRVIAERFPGLWDWAYTLYGAPTELYVRRDGTTPEIIRSLCGTRQGCPLGAQFFCLGLHPLLLAIQSMLGDRGVVVAYCDDIRLTSPPRSCPVSPPAPLHRRPPHRRRRPRRCTSGRQALSSPAARPPSMGQI